MLWKIYFLRSGGLFHVRADLRQSFRVFQTSLKSGFLLYNQYFATFLFGFSVCRFIEIELKPLLDLLNTEFTIIENGLFCGGGHRKQRIAGSIPGFH